MQNPCTRTSVLCAIVLLLIAGVMSRPARAQSCAGATGDCCSPHGGPGCSDFECCDTICFVEEFCCTVWDQGCADLAQAFCGSEACQPSGCPGTGPCCEQHSGQGCDDTACCEAVCDFDEFCCLAVWDSTCVGAAEVLCEALCTVTPCATSGDCCAPHGGQSCENESCCQAVCGDRPECCDTGWDQACATLAVTLCSGLCGSGHPGCPGNDVCCNGTVSVGCQNRSCCNLVCGDDAFCCESQWDNTCAATAKSLCPALCTCGSFADFDDDGDVTLQDFGGFQNCFTATMSPWADGCACAESNTNRRVDLADYAALRNLLDN